MSGGIDFIDQSADQIRLDPPPASDADGQERERELERAAACIMRHSLGAADAQDLLEACGLAGYQRGRFTSYQYGRPAAPPAAGGAVQGSGRRALPYRRAGKARAK